MSKSHLRNIRIAGFPFFIGGIGFAAPFDFNIVASVFGGLLSLIGLSAIIFPKYIRLILKIIFAAFVSYT